MKICGIYKVTNPNGQVYIGQSIDCDTRKNYYSRLKCKNQHKLYNSINKYGWSSHTFEVLHECSKDELNNFEVYYVSLYDSFKNGLNLTSGGERRKELSEESRKKISDARKGKPSPMKGKKFSEEAKKNMSTGHLNMSDKAKENFKNKLRKLKKGTTPWNKGIKGKQIAWNKGMTNVYSQETISKISKSHLGKKHTDESKMKMSASRTGDKNHFYGKHHSEETKRAISIKRKTRVGNKSSNYKKIDMCKLKELVNSKTMKELSSIFDVSVFVIKQRIKELK